MEEEWCKDWLNKLHKVVWDFVGIIIIDEYVGRLIRATRAVAYGLIPHKAHFNITEGPCMFKWEVFGKENKKKVMELWK